MSEESDSPIFYKVMIVPASLKEWQKLDSSIQQQFKKKLSKIRENPLIPKNKLSGMDDCYKIKLRRAGYRIVYQVVDKLVIIVIWAVDKREDSKVYESAFKRLKEVSEKDIVEVDLK